VNHFVNSVVHYHLCAARAVVVGRLRIGDSIRLLRDRIDLRRAEKRVLALRLVGRERRRVDGHRQSAHQFFDLSFQLLHLLERAGLLAAQFFLLVLRLLLMIVRNSNLNN